MSGAGRCAFSWGPPFWLLGVLLSSQDLLVVKLSPLCWLAAVRGAGGLSKQRALGCFRFHASLVVLRVLPGVGAGSEARGEAQVTIVFLCCDLLGSGTASPTVGGQAGRSLVMTTNGSFAGAREVLVQFSFGFGSCSYCLVC